MTTYLLELSLGPVQGFIKAARRSRDLWAGSRILSELARAAGKALIEEGATLIYPVEKRVQDPAPDETGNLSNILLARVDHADAARVRAIAEIAKEAARSKLREYAGEAWTAWQKAGVELREDIWQRQIEDAIEAFAAWAELSNDDYAVTYKRLKTSLAARKNTRDFGPMFPPGREKIGTGIPKCSFDGLRESVLPKERREFPSRFGLSPGEQLDALGCIKREVGKDETFTALPRLAAHGWLKTLTQDELERLRTAYEPLVKEDLATHARGNSGHYKAFPYDAGLLFPERLEIAKVEAQGAAAARAIGDLQPVLRELWAEHGRPCPYAALLVADGDRMGAFVARAKIAGQGQHTKVSAAIAAFADRVPGIARDHDGHAVFVGGEDLTLLFPLARLVEGARALAAAFAASMAEVMQQLEVQGDDRPSLRVGAAICHVLEPLSVIRERADAAEKYAKGQAGPGQGNALGLKLHIRSGQEISVRIGFADAPGFDALAAWCNAYRQGQVPGRLAYDTRAIDLHCRAIRAGADVAEADFQRLLARAKVSGGDRPISPEIQAALAERREKLAEEADENDPAGLARLADELILARWLAAVTAGEVDSTGAGQ
ncbi:MAG: type III-B CRISPR-associated protein Cas10/Cmr2 [Pseudomonadota bacterium]|nr:type III-B CRISPR-associated protein Cas10/Cmr2 [Pseudomonadota bacterium]